MTHQDYNFNTRKSDSKDDANNERSKSPLFRDAHDDLYASPLGAVNDFSFDERVAAVFPDMLRRSVPGYNTIITQCGLLTERFIQPHTNCYDLGCSLGATSYAMQKHINVEGCNVIAIDNSPAMLNSFKEKLSELEQKSPDQFKAKIELRCEDLTQSVIQNASVTALNFTLQFIPPNERLGLLQRIASGTVPGGVLILSEKVVFEDARLNNLHIDMYHQFKRANGYSDLEISQKRTALEKVLISDTLEQHQKRLQSAGFSSSSVWFQCFNFLSLVVLK